VYAKGRFLSFPGFAWTPSIVRFFLEPPEDDWDLVDRLSILPLLFDEEIEFESQVLDEFTWDVFP